MFTIENIGRVNAKVQGKRDEMQIVVKLGLFNGSVAVKGLPVVVAGN